MILILPDVTDGNETHTNNHRNKMFCFSEPHYPKLYKLKLKFLGLNVYQKLPFLIRDINSTNKFKDKLKKRSLKSLFYLVNI